MLPDYLRKKLEEIGYGPDSDHSAVTDALVAVFLTLDMYPLSEQERRIVLNLVQESSLALISGLPSMEDSQWEDFNYGNVRFGDFVRVKKNAYDSNTGSLHNGKVGVLVAGSSGRYTVRYIGASGVAQIRHPMGMLESLKMR